MIKRLRKITEGLYRGGAPSIQDVVLLRKFYGINKIISLDKVAGERIENICKILGIDHIQIPLDGTRKTLLNLLSHDIKKLLTEGGPTFIHCKEGKDRTGFLAALFKCKYMGVSFEEALDEAKSLGFGVGVPQEFVDLFVKTLKKICDADSNSADSIVENQREYMQDGRSSALDKAERGSFSPYLDKTRQYPYDAPYNYVYDQYPTRENMSKDPVELPEPVGEVPMVGMYDNSSGVKGVGPVENGGGFVNI